MFMRQQPIDRHSFQYTCLFFGTIIISDGWSLEKLKSPIWKELYFCDAVIQIVEDGEELSIKENLPIALKNFDIF